MGKLLTTDRKKKLYWKRKAAMKSHHSNSWLASICPAQWPVSGSKTFKRNKRKGL